ncbi:histone H1t [Acomys russatus]|uniref:histone H1t n=1 Tax=Acomys russatus TaxID=60746 RepID=UPI0021E1F7DF|nr:histone H1t [Acomys russatus]
MSEMAPAASRCLATSSVEKPPSKRRGKKPGLAAARKPRTFSVTRLIPEALSTSQERAGMSFAALKKALAATGYDVEKNNSRIKLALKRLVNSGVLVQTKGTGASGSFRLSRKAAPEKGKGRKPASAKAKKLGLPRSSRSPKSSKTKVVKKPKATPTKAPGGRRQAKGAKGVQPRNSPGGQARAANPSAAGKAKMTLQKADLRKASARK